MKFMLKALIDIIIHSYRAHFADGVFIIWAWEVVRARRVCELCMTVDFRDVAELSLYARTAHYLSNLQGNSPGTVDSDFQTKFRNYVLRVW